MATRFSGKVAVVTGGAMGIGNATARLLASQGATVFVPDLVAPTEGADRLTHIPCDASSAESIAAACSQLPSCDVLINNVAVQPEAPCHEHPLDAWQLAIAVNLTSHFLFSKHLLPHMLDKGAGAIVNVGSVQGLASQKGIPGYAASKGGVLSLTRQLAVEYAASGVRVNAISPGTINTPLVESVLRARGSSAEEAGRAYPMKRIGQPSEVAEAIAWLASDEASFVTGQNLVVDGGIMSLGGWAEVA